MMYTHQFVSCFGVCDEEYFHENSYMVAIPGGRDQIIDAFVCYSDADTLHVMSWLLTACSCWFGVLGGDAHTDGKQNKSTSFFICILTHRDYFLFRICTHVHGQDSSCIV